MRGVLGLGLLLLFWTFPTIVNCDDKLNGFIKDIISTFKLLSDGAIGQHHNAFLEKYRERIQTYIMTGDEIGWQHCDLLSSNHYQEEGVPQIAMDLDKIMTMNTKLTLSSSHCLLVSYHVSNEEDLSTLIEFGLKTLKHLRIAFAITMNSSINLEVATNSTNFPILLAVKLNNGEEKFLCPVVGEHKPRLQHEMCKPTYVTYKKKSLKIGLFGVAPYLVPTEIGFDGTDSRLISMLAEKLYFTPKIVIPSSFAAAEELAWKNDVDISMVRTRYSLENFNQSDFLGPVGSYEFHLMTGAPQERHDFMKIIRPFDNYSWACILVSLVLVYLSLVLTNKVYAATWSSSDMQETPYQTFFFCIGALTDEAVQDSYIAKSPCSRARQLLVMKWMFIGFFLALSYKSVLRAMMIRIDYDKTIDTIDDMVQSGLPIMIPGNTQIPGLLKTDPRKGIKALKMQVQFYNFIPRPPHFRPPGWVDEGICNHTLGSVETKPQFGPKCGVRYASKENLWDERTAFLLPQGSPLHRDFNMAILWWIGTGIYQKMEKDVYLLPGVPSYETKVWKQKYVLGDDDPLTINHILLPLVLFGISLFLSITTFCLELLPFLNTKRSESKVPSHNARKITVKPADLKPTSGGMQTREAVTQVKLEVDNKEVLDQIVMDVDEILVADVRKITVNPADSKSSSGGMHTREAGTRVKLEVDNKDVLDQNIMDVDEILVADAF